MESVINETVVQPGELITSTFVALPRAGTRSAYGKKWRPVGLGLGLMVHRLSFPAASVLPARSRSVCA